jgi:hypothetical protein
MKKFRNLTLSLLVVLFSIISINSYAGTNQSDDWLNVFKYEIMTLVPKEGEDITSLRTTFVLFDFQKRIVSIKYDKDKQSMLFHIVKFRLEKSGMILVCQNETGIYYMRLVMNEKENLKDSYFNFDLIVLDSDNNKIIYNASKAGLNPVK